MNTANIVLASESDPFAAIGAHIESIKSAHVAAFQGPVVGCYLVGATVWLYDHYNTAVVTGPSTRADSWTVTTWDADGVEDTYEYRANHLRPAAAPVQFRWAPATAEEGRVPCSKADCSHIEDSAHPAGHICPQP